MEAESAEVGASSPKGGHSVGFTAVGAEVKRRPEARGGTKEAPGAATGGETRAVAVIESGKELYHRVVG